MTDSIDMADAGFTPDPRRAIWISGRLDNALLERLRPEIAELVGRSHEPVTCFINSSGGSPEVAESILSLLRRTTQDDARASRIITVAAPKAESAAADLLTGGDWAITYPHSTLSYHGARWPLSDLVGAGEAGRLYAHTLATFHEINAAKLTHNSVRRFLFIVRAFRPLFAQHRADKGDPSLTDVQAFQEILRAKLSPAGQTVLERAIRLSDSSNELLFHFQKRLRRGRTVTKEHLRKLMIYSAVDFECDPAAWDAGLTKICDAFHFLDSYFDFGTLRDYVAGRQEPQTVGTDAEADYFLLFRFFFHALCRSLQQGENQLTPMDCVWFGLVDTVLADLTAP